MKYRIEVTPEHIKSGKPCWPQECPVALACHDVLGQPVSVVQRYIRPVHNNEADVRWALPSEVAVFIKAFDNGEHVTPIQFELDTDVRVE